MYNSNTKHVCALVCPRTLAKFRDTVPERT